MDSDVSVVDDSAAIRKILQRVLGQTGMAINTIHKAGDGQQALELLRSRRVNLVPHGYQHAENGWTRAAGSHQEIFRMGRRALRHDYDRGRRGQSRGSGVSGAAEYVRKPFTAVQFKEDLAGLLEPAMSP